MDNLASEPNTDEPAGARNRTIRLSMGLLAFAMALLVLVSFSIYAATADEESRFAPTTDNSYMDGATFEGSEKCGDCHSDEYDEWADTLHPKKIQVATDDTVVAPWDIDVTIPVADGVDATITLMKNSTGYWASLDDTDNHTYRADYVLGGFGWKQRFVTQIANSKYILPIQWNLETEGWVAYHASDWYDTTTGEAKMIAISQSWDRRCAGCHATGVEVEFNDTSGEWTATYSELGIGCEGCHGPGSLHVDPPDGEERADYIWNPVASSACGNCHVRGASVELVGGKTTGYPMMDGHAIRPGDDLADYYAMGAGYHGDGETSAKHHQQYVDFETHPHSDALSTIKENDHGGDSCLQCHSTDYRLADEDDKPTLENATLDIECGACHAPHGSDIDHDLRIPQDEICTQCHLTGDTQPGSSPHHSQKELLEGTITISDITGEPWMGGEVTCTDCHMPLTAKSAIEWDIASHTFYFVSPAKSIEFDMPNSCTVSCHGDGTPGDTMTDQEALDYIEEWKEETTALFDNATADLETAKTALDGAKDLGFSDTAFEAANTTYNKAKLARDWVNSDGTMVHNHEWAGELLTFASDKSGEIVTDLAPGNVTGIVKDGDGKAVSGAEVRKDDVVWGTTGADGSFEFPIAPGSHTFDVYKGDNKEKSFTATVVAGETADAGDIKFAAEEDDDTDYTLYIIIAVIVVILIVVVVMMMSKKGGAE
ncbi:MAG: ammonia-forming cytochrome c nitrite reductase subunit c552 [Thermoplasmata archaeon]|nr:ammonia-forming cytochrome c nitrite reductase subunit c552 [Thermoplasmata archaeon]